MNKKLIFIDNDHRERAEEQVESLKRHLNIFGGVKDNEYLDSIEIVPDFGFLDKDQVYKIIFDPRNCVISWSMYTANHFRSLDQMLTFLTAVGRNELKGLTYIDSSGLMPKRLASELYDNENAFAMLNAVEANNIISVDDETRQFYRLRVELKGVYENPFMQQTVDLNEILKLDPLTKPPRVSRDEIID